ncbi:MAG: sigma-70 family RNA polymerase sigma factor [Acidobacteria bacterium]|nr:sigma-70 family RNA polymerase sigma factor [Acidobacteriota bacterium]
MLGSAGEADDAVQEAWLRLSRSDANAIDNLGGWLTTVVARVCLDMLRSRTARREESLSASAPDSAPPSVVSKKIDPEQEAVMADSVGLALLVVLDRLDPAERLAFVLHDLFGSSFDEIAEIVGRTPEATRQLASRARRRVQGAPPTPGAALAQQRKVIDRFLTALRAADFEALVGVLDPDVEVLVDETAATPGVDRKARGAAAWAKQAITAARGAKAARPVLVDGNLGVVVAPGGRLFRVLRFTFDNDKIAAIEVIGDKTTIENLDLSVAPE